MPEDYCCSFCGRARREVLKLISGPRIFICDACVKACVEIATSHENPGGPGARQVRLLAVGAEARGIPKHCGFCGEHRRESRVSFGSTNPASPERCICAGCIGLCIELMEKEAKEMVSELLRSWPEASADIRDHRPTRR